MKSWKGRCVLVTGGTTGIGYEMARCLAGLGADLVVVARSAPRLAEMKKQFEREFGVIVRVIEKDLSQKGAVEEVYRDVQKSPSKIEALVNNAGFGGWGKFSETDLTTELEMIQLNVTALTHLTKLFVKDMVRAGRGRILNVASTAGFQPGPLMAVYYATKAYVLSFSEALSEELRGTGVTVTALCPGPTRTEFGKRSGMGKTHLFSGPLVMSAADVAREGVRAMEKGSALIVPGLTNKAMTFSLRLSPRSLVRRLVHGIQQKRQNT